MLSYKKIELKDFEAELKQLYEVCFSETKEGIRLTFSDYLSHAHVYAAFDGKICAALYIMPAEIVAKSEKNTVLKPVSYLFAAGTLPEYRGRGIMQGLVKFSLDSRKEASEVLNCLLPASEKLYGFYGLMGYETVFKKRVFKFNSKDLVLDGHKTGIDVLSGAAAEHITEIRNKRLSDKAGSILFPKEYVEFALKYYRLSGVEAVISCKDGYLLYYKYEDKLFVSEVLCEKEDLKPLLSELVKKEQAAEYYVNLPVWFDEFGTEEPNGMVYKLKDYEQEFKFAYLGLTFD